MSSPIHYLDHSSCTYKRLQLHYRSFRISGFAHYSPFFLTLGDILSKCCQTRVYHNLRYCFALFLSSNGFCSFTCLQKPLYKARVPFSVPVLMLPDCCFPPFFSPVILTKFRHFFQSPMIHWLYLSLITVRRHYENVSTSENFGHMLTLPQSWNEVFRLMCYGGIWKHWTLCLTWLILTSWKAVYFSPNNLLSFFP